MSLAGEPSRVAKNGRANGALKTHVSIHDVASKAHVSIATVSRFMNNPKLVASATAARVDQAIRELGYSPNPFAQGLITRASAVLGIVLPDIHGEFYSELLRGADAEARALGYNLLVSSGPRHRQDTGDSHHGGMTFGLIDGIAVMITDANNTFAQRARKTPLPTVVLDTDLAAGGVDSVVVDNARGSREAIEHLLAHTPAERTYFVGGPSENFDTRQRARAFEEGVASAGGSIRPDQVVYGEYSVEWGTRWAIDRLRAGTLSTAAVFAANDEIALGIMQVALDAGLRVPKDLRLVGFDDTRIASLMRPKLSSVHVPMAQVGASAVRLLVNRIAEPDSPISCVHLPTNLMLRESSAVS